LALVKCVSFSVSPMPKSSSTGCSDFRLDEEDADAEEDGPPPSTVCVLLEPKMLLSHAPMLLLRRFGRSCSASIVAIGL
jgi:hypothetical protein